MLRILSSLAALCLMAACATEPPPEPPLPVPPPAPRRAQVQRPAAPPRPQPAGINGDAAATPAVVAAAAQPAPATAEPAWRVARDGVVGCANRATLAVLDQGAEGTPRLLAEARASGGCRTTFRVNQWALDASDGEAVRLRMTNGGPLTLWFRRGEVVAP